jgi:hypothetical protein
LGHLLRDGKLENSVMAPIYHHHMDGKIVKKAFTPGDGPMLWVGMAYKRRRTVLVKGSGRSCTSVELGLDVWEF